MEIYFVETKADEEPLLICRWTETFHEKGKRVQIMASSMLSAEHLNHLLWVFSQSSFIPHRICPPGGEESVVEPVVITVGGTPLKGFPVIVCERAVDLDTLLDHEILVHPVVMDDTARRQESRLMWQEARGRGMALKHFSHSPGSKPES